SLKEYFDVQRCPALFDDELDSKGIAECIRRRGVSRDPGSCHNLTLICALEPCAVIHTSRTHLLKPARNNCRIPRKPPHKFQQFAFDSTGPRIVRVADANIAVGCDESIDPVPMCIEALARNADKLLFLLCRELAAPDTHGAQKNHRPGPSSICSLPKS